MSIIIKSATRQDIKPSEITSESAYLNRREFIKTSGILVGAAWASCLSLSASAKSSDYGSDFPSLKKTAYGKSK